MTGKSAGRHPDRAGEHHRTAKSPASRSPGQWGYIAISDLTFSD
nr:MAG TPA: hypothetical protein [Bacteriophage sp.]